MQVTGMYFSPCGNVEKIIRTMAEAAAERLGTKTAFADFTRPRTREREYRFGPEDLVFVGVPVYAGRVPNKIAPFAGANIRGAGAAVPVVCFGNRSFDNALSELYGMLRKNGFAVPAAAAMAGQHGPSHGGGPGPGGGFRGPGGGKISRRRAIPVPGGHPRGPGAQGLLPAPGSGRSAGEFPEGRPHGGLRPV